MSKLRIAINEARSCDEKVASGRDTSIGYHSIAGPSDATFAMVSFASAGMRLFDIRNPDDRHRGSTDYSWALDAVS